MRTLILDDQEPIVSMLSRVCRDEGHEVTPFTNSATALIHLATEPVDMLITDMHMPGADGVTVIREARRLQPDIFTLIITGHAAQFPIAEILSSGTADVMFKPFHMNELRARLSLAERRRHLLAFLHQQQRDLHAASREMISGLEKELADVQRADVPAPARR
jgi:DNA-binding response OmpR family regulator